MPQSNQCVLYLADGRTKTIEADAAAVRLELRSALQGWMEQGARQSYPHPMVTFPTDKEECYINAMQVVEVEEK